MKYQKNNYTENIIVDKYLKKLNFNKEGTFNFENDAAYLNLENKYKLTITTDSISENIDFFKNDSPKSIAKKITTINLSDIYAMGANPHSYLMNLYLPSYITKAWLNSFSNELKKIQLKYNFYLLGGDLSRSDNLIISSTFIGYLNKNLEVFQNKFSLYDDIWVSGNIGDSKIGLEILNKKIIIKNNLKKYFIDKYYYPTPCNLGPKIVKYCSSMKDISDGLIGDLKKMLNNKAGALIDLKKIPLSSKTNQFMNKNKTFTLNNVLNAGDDYCLLIVANKKYRNKLKKIASINNTKISCIGKIVPTKGVHCDSSSNLNNFKEFDHFS